MAPELFKNEEYDTKVDVFSFALILQEVINTLHSLGISLKFRYILTLPVNLYDCDCTDD